MDWYNVICFDRTWYHMWSLSCCLNTFTYMSHKKHEYGHFSVFYMQMCRDVCRWGGDIYLYIVCVCVNTDKWIHSYINEIHQNIIWIDMVDTCWYYIIMLKFVYIQPCVFSWTLLSQVRQLEKDRKSNPDCKSIMNPCVALFSCITLCHEVHLQTV